MGIKKPRSLTVEKSERVAKEGCIQISIDNGKVAVSSIYCETDFVARNEGFIKVAKDMARLTRESIMVLPDRLAPILAGTNDYDEIYKLLTEELNIALRNLSLTDYDFFEGKDLDGE